MSYWKKWFGNEYGNKEFIRGIAEGVRVFAVNKDGGQIVGTLQRPLKEILEELKQDLGWKDEWGKL